jgi:hypothetical protein
VRPGLEAPDIALETANIVMKRLVAYHPQPIHRRRPSVSSVKPMHPSMVPYIAVIDKGVAGTTLSTIETQCPAVMRIARSGVPRVRALCRRKIPWDRRPRAIL